MSTEIQSSLAAQSAANFTSTAKASLGKDDFLKMLVMQLRNQDPLDPLKGTEFAAQLAQFSSVEQLTNLNAKVGESIDVNTMTAKSINNALATTYIGKGVRASTDTFKYSGDGNVKLGYSLSSAAEKTNVKVYDSSGNLVRTMQSASTSKGDNTITWDGKNENGIVLGKGSFTFKVEAVDANENAISASPYIYGKVSSVKFRSDGTVFVIDGLEILLSNILEISEG